MNFSGPQTKLGAALDGARDELAGLPVAGVVLVTDGADTSDASLDPALLAMKAQKLPGVHRRRRQRAAAAGRADRSRHDAAHGAEGRLAARRRGREEHRLRRSHGDGGRRGRRPDHRVGEGPAAVRRLARAGARAGDRVGARSAALQVQGVAAGRRARHAEQRARVAGQRARRPRADPLLRGRAALRDEVPAPRASPTTRTSRSSRCSARRTTSTCGCSATSRRIPKSWSAGSRRRAKSCSSTAASSSAASKPACSRAISCR